MVELRQTSTSAAAAVNEHFAVMSDVTASLRGGSGGGGGGVEDHSMRGSTSPSGARYSTLSNTQTS